MTDKPDWSASLEKFVPDPAHINARPIPLRRYIHDLATRSDPQQLKFETFVLAAYLDCLSVIQIRKWLSRFLAGGPCLSRFNADSA